MDKQMVQIPITELIKKSMVQIKYEEIGSWLAMHRTPLFYAHKEGFTVVDQKYIDEHKDLKKALDKIIKDLAKKKITKTEVVEPAEKAEYIG